MAELTKARVVVTSRDLHFSEVTHEFLPLLLEYHDANEAGDSGRLDAAREKIERFLRDDRNRLSNVRPHPECERAARRAASDLLVTFKVYRDGDEDTLRSELHRAAYSHLVWELEAQRLRRSWGFLGRWVRILRLALVRCEP